MPEAALRRWAPAWQERRVALALSGGLDSTVLLHALVRVIGPARVLALHVHHGLQPAAQAWLEHCQQVAGALGVGFEGLRVDSRPPVGASLEQWARDARQDLLAAALARHGLEDLLMAHHADDQAETILLRLGRGAGLAGMAGMASRSVRRSADIPAACAAAGPPAGPRPFTLWRPLLDLPRARLLTWAREQGLDWVEDPSNADLRVPRNALRHEVLPALERAQPGWRAAMLRNAEHWRAAGEALDELAVADLAAAWSPGVPLRIDRRPLQALGPARQAQALRFWLTRLGLRAPSSTRLAELRRQLLQAGSAHALLDHEGRTLCRDGDRIVAWPASGLQAWAERRHPGARQAFEAAAARAWCESLADLRPGGCWTLELVADGVADRGRLMFVGLGPDEAADAIDADAIDAAKDVQYGADPASDVDADRQADRAADLDADHGSVVIIDAGWLLGPDIGLDLSGASAWSMRIAAARPGRSLKHHHQTQRVPPWLRCLLPTIGGSGRALYNAAFGLDRRADLCRPPPGLVARPLRLHWQPPSMLVPVLRAYRHPWPSDPSVMGIAPEGRNAPV